MAVKQRSKAEVALKRAIQKFARADATHDESRKTLVAGAAGLRDLIPDNWQADGSLRDATSWTSLEQRETHNDLAVALSDALADLLDEVDGFYYGWVQDWTADTVYFQAGGSLYGAPYAVEPDGPVTISDPVKVRPITSYVSTERAAGACDLCAGAGKIRRGAADCPECHRAPRAARRTTVHDLEWRKAKAPAKGQVERRSIAIGGIELRAADGDSDALLFSGYASLAGVPYDMGFYSETVERGALRRSLNNADLDVQLLVNHTGLPLARTTSGTLRLSEDSRGLKVEADLDPTDPDVMALVPKMRRGDLTEMSFAFRVVDQEWSDDYLKRSLKALEIHRGDVSIVSYGASPTTSATIRSDQARVILDHLGGEPVFGAFVKRLEVRAGKALSSATMETLTQVLNLVAAADDAVDEVQPLLAELMGVADPDADEADEPAERSALPLPDYTKRARLLLAATEGRAA